MRPRLLNRRLKHLSLKIRDLQIDFPRPGSHRLLLAVGVPVLPPFPALVATGAAPANRFGIHKRVPHLPHRAPDHAAKIIPNRTLVDLDNLTHPCYSTLIIH